jgi:hypothetical protein
LSVYNWNQNLRRANQPQEGYFDGAVFYHRYTVAELEDLIGKFLEVDQIMGVHVNLPWTYRALQISGLQVPWDRLWRKTAVALQYSHLLVAVCHRRR